MATDPEQISSPDETVPVYARVLATDLAGIERYIQDEWPRRHVKLTRSDVIRIALRQFLERESARRDSDS